MDSSEQKGLISQRKFTPKCYLIIMASLLSEYIIISPLAKAEARRMEKNFWAPPPPPPPPPPLSQGLNDRAPPLSDGLYPPLPCKGIQDRLDPGFHSMTSITSGFQYWSLDSLSVELGFWIPVDTAIPDFLFLELYSGFQSPGFLISHIQNSWIPDFARKE